MDLLLELCGEWLLVEKDIWVLVFLIEPVLYGI